MRRAWRAASMLVVACALASCGTADDSPTVLVMAAASLTDAFEEIEQAYEAANPDVDVQLNFAGSTALREQILEGAPADVFASANVTTMAQVVDGEAAETWVHFATNELVIAVPTGNPANVASLEDLADPDKLIGLCADGVPCGVFARRALARAGVNAQPDTNEGDVRALLTKLEAGELDAGIVYATDAASSADVESFPVPGSDEIAIVYPLAVLGESDDVEQARDFVTFVTSPAGQSILVSHGFGAAPDTQVVFGCRADAAAVVIAAECGTANE